MFGWLKDNWKKVATVAAAVTVGVVVTVATGGLGAPLLVAAAAGGLAAGGAGYTVDRWLHGQPWRPGEFAQAAVVSGVLAAATAGVGQLAAPVVAPVVSSVVPRAVSNAVPPLLASSARNAAVGSLFGGGTQVVMNAVQGRPLTENVTESVVTGGVTGAVVGPIVETVVPGAGATTTAADDALPRPPSETRGIVNALEGGGVDGPNIAQSYPPRDFVAEGAFKRTYRTDQPGVLVRVVKGRYPAQQARQILASEDDMLRYLADQGIPTMRIIDRGQVNGRAADVVEEYAASSRPANNDFNTLNPAFEARLNGNSLADIQTIRAALHEKGLTIADLQFLIREDGHIVVADPYAVFTRQQLPTLGPEWANLTNQAARLDQVEQAIWRRIMSKPGGSGI